MTKRFAPNNGYRVLTPTGWQSFAGVASMGEKPLLNVEFDDASSIRCSESHHFIDQSGHPISAASLRPESIVVGQNKPLSVIAVEPADRIETTFSLVEVEGGHTYFTAGIASKNCDFISEDETLIDPLTLARMSGRAPEFFTGTVRWYADPEPNKTFLVALDPSLGTGGDYGAVQVFQLPEMIQIAEWQHNTSVPRVQVRTMMQILLYLQQTLTDDYDQTGEPEIYWTVENNTIGEAILQIIEDTGEERFPGNFVSERKRKGQVRRFRKGMNTDNKKKLSACAKLKSLIESGRMKINSHACIKQFKNFVAKDVTYSAKPGEHDDLITALLLICRMLDVVIAWSMENDVNVLREMIDPEEAYVEAMPSLVLTN